MIRYIIGMSLQGITLGGVCWIVWKLRGIVDRVPPAGWVTKVSERLKNLGQGNGLD